VTVNGPEFDFGERRVFMAIQFKEFSIPDDDMERAAVIIAINFYKQLKRNNFEDDQVIAVASELISILSNSLEGYIRKKEGRE